MFTTKENLRRQSRFGLIILVLVLWYTPGWAATNILKIRHWVAPDHARIVIDTSEEAQYRVVKEEKRLSIEIADASYVKTGPQTIVIKKPGIDRIVASSPGDGQVLIELYLTDHTETRVFRVKKFEGKPDRIVVDIILPEVEKQDQEDRERVKESTKDKIVVIDPGHGGEDPGAVGRQGTQEKKVVLKSAKRSGTSSTPGRDITPSLPERAIIMFHSRNVCRLPGNTAPISSSASMPTRHGAAVSPAVPFTSCPSAGPAARRQGYWHVMRTWRISSAAR